MSYEFKTIEQSEIQNKVEFAIKKLIKEDGILLYIDSNERSITHKFAEHLQRNFIEWDVDCEYNRDSHDLSELAKGTLSKELESWVNDCKKKEENKKNPKVNPDIIIHHRLTRENLLVIEIKKTTNTDDVSCDKKKLKAFIKDLHYQYGLFIKFKAKEKIGIEELCWFKE